MEGEVFVKSWVGHFGAVSPKQHGIISYAAPEITYMGSQGAEQSYKTVCVGIQHREEKPPFAELGHFV